MTKREIILITIGVFQDYLIDNIRNLKDFNNTNITLIIDDDLIKDAHSILKTINVIPTSKININDFESKNRLGTSFRQGFEKNTTKRLFYLYYYMKQFNRSNCIHIENDNHIYIDVDKLNFRDDRLYLTRDSDNRCIAGFMYIPKFNLLDNLINNYIYHCNDMINLDNFQKNNQDICIHLPLLKQNINYDINDELTSEYKNFSCIFDACAIGQYLGGVDPRNISGDTTGFINETCRIDYNKYKFYWKKIDNTYFNSYTPHILIDDEYIPIINLHIHSKRLNEFMGSKPLQNKYIEVIHNDINIITGEKIQLLCDHFIGNIDDFVFNPVISKYTEKHIDINSDYIVDNDYRVFCYTHLLDNVDLLIKRLSKFANKCVLVFHNSDNSFNKEHLVLLEKLDIVDEIYTQNVNVIHDKVIPIPIGLANYMWNHGNLDLFTKILQENNRKDNLIYFNFGINTNIEKRIDCYNKLTKKGLTFSQNLPYESYLRKLSKTYYCISPEGNGIDCHRFWECLYLKVVPICKRNLLVELFATQFPVIIVDDWDKLDLDSLTTDIDWSCYNNLDFKTIIKLFS